MCLKLCKTYKFQTKDGKNIILRRPRMKDAKQLLNLVNSLVEEDAQILTNKKMTLKEEKEWLKDRLKQIRKNKVHYLVAEYKGEIIAGADLTKKKWRQSHVAEYGISVKKGYRNIGLGSKLTKIMLDIGRRDKEIKIISLNVYPTNKAAIHLYKKFGFRKVAVLKKRIKYKGKYIDDIVMDLKKQKI